MNVFFRLDLSTQAGLGHLARCVVLAEMFRTSGWTSIFFENVNREALWRSYSPAHQFELCCFSAESQQPGDEFGTCWSEGLQVSDAKGFIAAIKRYGGEGLVVVDHYGLDIRWQNLVRCSERALLVFDDYPLRRHNCDLLINNFPLAAEYLKRYRVLTGENTTLLLGPEYLLLRPEIYRLALERPDEHRLHASLVLSFFGGSDTTGLSRKMLAAMENLDEPNFRLKMLVGPNNQDGSQLVETASKLESVDIKINFNEVSHYLRMVTLAIGGMGVSLWERMYARIPNIVVSSTPFHDSLCRKIERVGAIRYLGPSKTITSSELSDAIQELIADSKATESLVESATDLLKLDKLSTVASSVSDKIIHHLKKPPFN